MLPGLGLGTVVNSSGIPAGAILWNGRPLVWNGMFLVWGK